MTWDDFEYWKSKDWEQVQEKLDELDKAGTNYNPSRELLFAALDSVSFDDTHVCIVGQDPYPDPKFCTGLAFSIPQELKVLPSTLVSLFEVYTKDLKYPIPTNGSLSKWAGQGVLLWNSWPVYYPVFDQSKMKVNGARLNNWPLESLTRELVSTLAQKSQGCVFAFLGRVAQEFIDEACPQSNPVICSSHPSPRAGLRSSNPFKESRLFSTINARLVELDYPAIDWKL